MNTERILSLTNFIFVIFLCLITVLKLFGLLKVGIIEFALVVLIIGNLINHNNIISIKNKIK